MDGEGRSASNTRLQNYKNKGIDSEELRRRREDESVQLRKQKREEHVIIFILKIILNLYAIYVQVCA